jgi:hypothetical protein
MSSVYNLVRMGLSLDLNQLILPGECGHTSAEELERPAPVLLAAGLPVLFKCSARRGRVLTDRKVRHKVEALPHVLRLCCFVHVLLSRPQNARVHEGARDHRLRVEAHLHCTQRHRAALRLVGVPVAHALDL